MTVVWANRADGSGWIGLSSDAGVRPHNPLTRAVRRIPAQWPISNKGPGYSCDIYDAVKAIHHLACTDCGRNRTFDHSIIIECTRTPGVGRTRSRFGPNSRTARR
ncbi:hypothetical protein GCM10022227_07890 [Streptomyces sedi]